MPKEKSRLANSLKKYRNELGIFQNVLTKRTNLAFHTIAKIETDSMPNQLIETIKKCVGAWRFA